MLLATIEKKHIFLCARYLYRLLCLSVRMYVWSIYFRVSYGNMACFQSVYTSGNFILFHNNHFKVCKSFYFWDSHSRGSFAHFLLQCGPFSNAKEDGERPTDRHRGGERRRARKLLGRGPRRMDTFPPANGPSGARCWSMGRPRQSLVGIDHFLA